MIALLLAGLAAASCTELPVVPEAPGAEPSEGPCAAGRIRAAGRVFATTPEAGLSRGFAAPHLRSQLTVGAPGDVSTRIAFVMAQTGGAAGYIAVAGESWVPIMQIAEVRWDWKQTGLAIAAGMVDDPWVVHELRIWGLVPIAPGMALAQGWIERADVGSWVGWTSPDRWVSANLTLQAGEGWRRRERNNGVNLSGQVIARPMGGGDQLELMLYAREGSRGVLSARDHRLGFAVSGGPDPVKFALEGVMGWGLAADGALTPGGVSALARTDELPVAAWLRLDHTRTERSVASTGTSTVYFGVGPRLPWNTEKPSPAYLTVGGEARLPSSDGGPTAGAPASSFTGFVQLTADIGASWAKDKAP